jgi:hypothetical protein
MSTVGAANSSASVYMYIHLCTYTVFYYTYTVHVYYIHNRKKCGCQDRKFNILFIRCGLQHSTQHVAHTHIFEKELFRTTAVQKKQNLDEAGCHVFGGLISTFVFDMLQIPSQCIQICDGCIAPTYTPLAMGLVYLLPQGKFPPRYKAVSSNICLQ